MPAFVILLLLLFAVFYVLMVRPQRQRQAQHKTLIDNVGVGEDVLTTGGIYGTVTQADGDDVVVEIADGVEVHMTRRGIAAILPPEAEEEDELEEADEEPAELPEAIEEGRVTGVQGSVTGASRGNSSADDDR